MRPVWGGVLLPILLGLTACWNSVGSPVTALDEDASINPASELYAPSNRPMDAYLFSIPSLDAPPVDGAPSKVDLADYAGKPTLVIFWAEWCSWCRQEMPELEVLHRACFKPNDMGLVGVVVEGRQQDPFAVFHARGFVESQGFTFESGFDYDNHVTARYLPFAATPSYVFVDHLGRVAGLTSGARGIDLLRNSMGVLADERQPGVELQGC